MATSTDKTRQPRTDQQMMEDTDEPWEVARNKFGKRPRQSDSPPQVSDRNPHNPNPTDPKTRPSPRFTVVFKSRSPMSIPEMDHALLEALPELIILNQHLTPNRRTLFYKLKDPEHSINKIINVNTPVPILDTLALSTKYEHLTAEHYDPSAQGAKQSPVDPLIVIARNVPLEYTAKDLIEAMATETQQYIKHATRLNNTGFIKITTTDKNIASNMLEEGLRALGRVFRCEQQRPRPDIQRCYNCQALGHSHHSCKSQTKCPKCGGAHEYKKCQPENQYACPNCGGNHAAWSALCPAVKKHLQEKKEKETQKMLKAPENQPVTQKLMHTYSTAVQEKIHKVEETTNKHLISTDALKSTLEQSTVQLMNTMITLQKTLIEKIEYIHQDLATLNRLLQQETTTQLEDTLTPKALTIEMMKSFKYHHEQIIKSQETIHTQITKLIQGHGIRTRDTSKESTHSQLPPVAPAPPKKKSPAKPKGATKNVNIESH